MGNDHHSILHYHQATAHIRGQITGRTLNWETQPVPFKLYRDIPTFHLSQDLALPDTPLHEALDERPLIQGTNMPAILGAICNLTAGISLVRKQTDGKAFHFRTTASAGALYPAELYIALQNVSGMNDGLYHYCALEHTLNHLRSGPIFIQPGNEPTVRFYLSSIYYRSAWKYGPRAYRYCMLDTGHMAENLLLATRLHGLPSTLSYDFNDRAITRLLGIDPAHEGCLAQVHALGCSAATKINESAPFTVDGLPLFSRSAEKATTPETMLAAHETTSSFARCPVNNPTTSTNETTPLPDPIVPASTSATIMNRRSRRNFITRPAPTRDLVDILGLLCRDDAPDCTNALQVGILASEHSGLTPGYHHLNRADCSTTLIKPGNFMTQAARVCLDQGWLENAAIHIIFTADLETLTTQCGPRAYRYAHLEAGRLGQRAYLAATAKKLGACGIGAYFDQEAATLLSLPKGHALLYLVALGPIRR